MYKKITLIPGVKTPSPRIPHEVVATAKRYHSLNEQAKACARDIVRKANHESDAIYSRAYLSGFEQGIMCSIQDLMCYLSASEMLAETIISQATRYLEQQLKDFFSEDEVICCLLEKWLVELHTISPESDKLILTLPAQHRAATARLQRLFAEAGLNVEIRFIQTSLITLEHFNVIWSCDISALSTTLSKNALEEILNQHDIYEACHINSIHSLNQLKETLERYCQSADNNDECKEA